MQSFSELALDRLYTLRWLPAVAQVKEGKIKMESLKIHSFMNSVHNLPKLLFQHNFLVESTREHPLAMIGAIILTCEVKVRGCTSGYIYS